MARSQGSRKAVTRRLTRLSIEEEIGHLRSLDLIGLQCRWQSVMGRPAPEHLPKHLLFGILAIVSRPMHLGISMLPRFNF